MVPPQQLQNLISINFSSVLISVQLELWASFI